MREFFLKDLSWKLFSLLLALAIWVTVHKIQTGSSVSAGTSNDSQVTYSDLPVLPVAASSDVHLYRIVPPTVKVTVTGSPAAIAVLQANRIRATVDLTGFAPESDLKCNVDISVPAGITVVSVDPQRVGVINPPPPTQ